jgi:endonuclease III related protein
MWYDTNCQSRMVAGVVTIVVFVGHLKRKYRVGQLADPLRPVKKTPEFRISVIYRTLVSLWGVQHWWPAETPFEVIIGAILVQNTAWTNAAKALHSLRTAGALSLEGVRQIPLAQLEQGIRSSGYYRQKAARLKSFVLWLDQRYHGSLEQMLQQPTASLRQELLALCGIGHETADTILLYAAQWEIFVVDADARRILERHGIVAPNVAYDDIRLLVETALTDTPELGSQSSNLHSPVKLPPVHSPSVMSQFARSERAQAFNEIHALLVQVGKHYCHRGRALCEECPIRFDLPKPTL